MATSRIGGATLSLMPTSPFLGGLNTELPGVVDSTEFTKDELNMMIRADNTRSRRPGVDYEELYRFNNEVIPVDINNLAFNSIEWTDVNSPDESQTYTQIPYIVVQIGGKIIFYRNHGQPYSGDQAEFSLDLASYRIDATDNLSYQTERCKFTVAYGCLFITSKAIRPIRLKSAQEEAVTPTVITYPYCDVAVSAFQGKHARMQRPNDNREAWYEFYYDSLLLHRFVLDPGQTFPNSYTMAQNFNSLSSTARRGIVAVPFETEANHWTNRNEGWPSWSPYDYITFRGTDSSVRGIKITIKVFGWAVKSGKFRTHENSYSAFMAGGSSNYTQSTGLTLAIRDTFVGANDFLNIDENPQKMSYAHLYNLLNQGWTTKLIATFFVGSTTDDATRFFPGNNLAQQYLKDEKTEAFKPEALINTTFGNTPAARGHFKLNFFNQDRNAVGSLSNSMSQLASDMTEAYSKKGISKTVTVQDILDTNFPIDPEDPAKQVPVIKPRRDYVSDIMYFAGRIFYLCGDVLLYSQMISEDISRADQCYSDADPTSEELSDVIETDGGLISLPDIGDGIKLAAVGSYLCVFGTRGNVYISGTANNIFTATAYSQGSLLAVPTQAPDSFVSTEFGVFYWGTTGISVLGLSEGGVAAQDLSTQKILTWFGRLTNTQHKYCKGVYSSSKKKIYWFYPSNEDKPRRLDLCLVYDIQRGSFAPQKIATQELDDESGEMVDTNTPEIVSGFAMKVPFKSIKEYPVSATVINSFGEEETWEVLDDEDGYKILAEDPVDSEEFTYESSALVCLDVASGKITFGDFRSNLLRDWIAGDFDGVGYIYDSYLISHPMNASGYTTGLNPQRANNIVFNKNMPYLISFFRRTERGITVDGDYLYPSKCHGSILWDWRTSGDNSKWDSPQELYRPSPRTIFSEGYISTKTNIRGIGRAYQVKLESVEDNQFIIEALCMDLMNDGRI